MKPEWNEFVTTKREILGNSVLAGGVTFEELYQAFKERLIKELIDEHGFEVKKL